MRLKLDENLGRREAAILRAGGHDVRTVPEQGMTGWQDGRLAEACAREGRCLVTLDTGFADPLAYPPGRSRGIVVLRVPGRQEAAKLDAVVRTLAEALRPDLGAIPEGPAGRLWIVEPGRVRVFRGDDAEDDLEDDAP